MLTVGVEEEYLLVDAVSGQPTPAADRVSRVARAQPALGEDDVQRELLQAQLEVATPPCETLDEVGGHLLRLRSELVRAAESEGCRLLATGAAPLHGDGPAEVTRTQRYEEIHDHAPRLVDEQLINGMHVHVAVPDRRTGVSLLNRLRPWLPVLLAMGVNSPVWDGRDTGFASWRSVHFERWPVSGPPPHFDDEQDYERRADALVATGVIRDRAQLYWQARLSDNYPTIEVRCWDVQLRADDAVLLAGLLRALVARLLADASAGEVAVPPPPELVRAAAWHAARGGLTAELVDLPHGGNRDAREVVSALLEHLRRQLDETGDTEQISALLDRLLREGTGAERQRAVLERYGLSALVRWIGAETAGGAG
ncbi:MAG: glutamate--cysteine ligase [Actinomycetota bacterium]|nr:glutamate--cysteine ligase [Actinomycetota bacterium]